jgi:hypothetical protein
VCPSNTTQTAICSLINVFKLRIRGLAGVHRPVYYQFLLCVSFVFLSACIVAEDRCTQRIKDLRLSDGACTAGSGIARKLMSCNAIKSCNVRLADKLDCALDIASTVTSTFARKLIDYDNEQCLSDKP